jgi:amino acid transporter
VRLRRRRITSVAKRAQAPKLGTFLGIYTPTILTILGVIMYLRVGWLTGHLGLVEALLAIGLANLITLLTTLSFSSVATNISVGIGGAYYIISRSLGVEIGGAIGVPLYLAQVFSTTLYAFGLSEALQLIWPQADVQLTTVVVVLAVSAVSIVGSGFAVRIQIPALIAVGISLVALAVGALGAPRFPSITLTGNGSEVGFWAGFAVFFPAVTGIMAGLGLSGDLKDPARSILRGATLAVLTGFVVYATLPVLLALAASDASLRTDTLIWTRIAPGGAWLVFPGLLGAIFSSAIGSMLAAPRTLQALALDGVAPRLFGRSGESTFRALLPGFVLSVGLALAAVSLGNLNGIAPFVTMFFLTVYGAVNLVAAFEAISRDPSWRPRFRMPWPLNLAGALACGAVMFLINPWAGLIAILLEVGLFTVLSRTSRRARFGDVRRGLYLTLIRWFLMGLARRPASARNWRPHILAFVGDLHEDLPLVHFASWLSQGRGVVSVAHLRVGDLIDLSEERTELRQEMRALYEEEGLPVFPQVQVVQNLVQGIVAVSQAHGIAGLESNTILLGWPERREQLVQFLECTKRLEHLNKSVVIARIQPEAPVYGPRGVREVHVWWGGLKRNSDLMLLLAYLLKLNQEWREAAVRVMSVSSSHVTREGTERYLSDLLAKIRIDAEVRVVEKRKEVTIAQTIHDESADAQIVFLGLGLPEDGEEDAYAERLVELAGDLPAVLFVKNSSLFMGQLLESDEPPVDEEQAGASEENGDEERTQEHDDDQP